MNVTCLKNKGQKILKNHLFKGSLSPFDEWKNNQSLSQIPKVFALSKEVSAIETQWCMNVNEVKSKIHL